jgi:hypothetical protein
LIGAGIGAGLGLLELLESLTPSSILATVAAGATFGALLGATVGLLRNRSAVYLICGCAGGLAGVAWAFVRQSTPGFAMPMILGIGLGLLCAFGELAAGGKHSG